MSQMSTAHHRKACSCGLTYLMCTIFLYYLSRSWFTEGNRFKEMKAARGCEAGE